MFKINSAIFMRKTFLLCYCIYSIFETLKQQKIKLLQIKWNTQPLVRFFSQRNIIFQQKGYWGSADLKYAFVVCHYYSS